MRFLCCPCSLLLVLRATDMARRIQLAEEAFKQPQGGTRHNGRVPSRRYTQIRSAKLGPRRIIRELRSGRSQR